MVLEWLNSDPSLVELQWQEFEQIIEINPDKELLRIDMQIVNEEGFPIYFDKLSVKQNITNNKLAASYMSAIPIEGASLGIFERLVFGTTQDVRIVSVSFATEEAITGTLENQMKWSIINNKTSIVICTRTIIEDVQVNAKGIIDFGPIDADTEIGAVLAGETISFKKEDTVGGMTVPRGLLIINWDIV